jgi:hypothetical protein
VTQLAVLQTHDLIVTLDPCDQMIVYLKQYFHPTHGGKDESSNLAIRSGKNGIVDSMIALLNQLTPNLQGHVSRMTIRHNTRMLCRLSPSGGRSYMVGAVFRFLDTAEDCPAVDMFHLWSLAEDDLLSESVRYRLVDTGQGLNRVQGAPKTSRMMYAILDRAQRSIGSWVGSSVVHMGDRDVPNALTFIGTLVSPESHMCSRPHADKYSQIYRILLPICNCIGKIETLQSSAAMQRYVSSEFGSTDGLIRAILGDFFRHAVSLASDLSEMK